MTILQITSLLTGGAGQEVLSMHRALINMGHESYIIVRGKMMIDTHNNTVSIKYASLWFTKLKRLLYRFILKFIKVEMSYAPYNLSERFMCYNAQKILQKLPKSPDVIFVKWASGFANARFINELQKVTTAKIVITFVDQAPLTGGCHYPNDCENYNCGCVDCPISKSEWLKKNISKNFQYKKEFIPKSSLILVASSGDEELVKKSILYRENTIIKTLTCIDSKIFVPGDKKRAKESFGIDPNLKVVLCGCTHIKEKRKGISYLIEALNLIKYKNFIVLQVGDEKIENLKCNVRYVGYLNQKELVSAYQAADVFVCPSIADSGPMMINQSLMVGTPVVSFPIGVAKDLVRTMQTGYLAKLSNSLDLAIGIDKILSMDNKEYIKMTTYSREMAVKKYNVLNSESSLDRLLDIVIKQI